MTTDQPPWEPPFAGSEVEHLLGALDRQRFTFRWKAGGLDAAGLNRPIGSSALTLGKLLKHLALVEDDCSGPRLDDSRIGMPWEGGDWASGPGWDFRSAPDDSPEELYELWDQAVERSRARFGKVLAAGGPEQLIHLSDPAGRHANLRRLLFDMIEEYGRHTGHADLLRENVDGLVGEDPPADWRP